MIPFQITFNDFEESDAVWLAVQDRIEKLEHYFERIIRCDVILSCPHRHRHADRLYHVQIRVHIPGDDIFISRNPSEDESHRDIYVAIRDAFDAAERRLERVVDKMRFRFKTENESPRQEGRVSKLFYAEGYGFVQTTEGREFYFSKNSVLNNSFERLKLGQKVHFIEEPGEQGPQITSMTAS